MIWKILLFGTVWSSFRWF